LGGESNNEGEDKDNDDDGNWPEIKHEDPPFERICSIINFSKTT
jgi:hypothetical protein